jgi:hypothetical protein
MMVPDIDNDSGSSDLSLKRNKDSFSAKDSLSHEQRYISVEVPGDGTRKADEAATAAVAVFDPLSATHARQNIKASLLDDEDDDMSVVTCTVSRPLIPVSSAYLEMGEESPKTPDRIHAQAKAQSPYEPIKTKSGLLLTHRRTPLEAKSNAQQNQTNESFKKKQQQQQRLTPSFPWSGTLASENVRRTAHSERFDYEHPFYNPNAGSGGLTKLLSYVRLWVLISALVLFVATLTLVHHVRQESDSLPATVSDLSYQEKKHQQQQESFTIARIVAMEENQQQQQYDGNLYSQQQNSDIRYIPEQVLLLPLPEPTNLADTQKHGRFLAADAITNDPPQKHHSLSSLRHDFNQWIEQHSKVYESVHEKEERFKVWAENHLRTQEKNERHGPCKLTQQPVFGSTVFQDLTTEEFKSKFLTGYNTTRPLGKLQTEPPDEIRSNWRKCAYYDVSCYLKYFFETYLYGIGATMEPAYDKSSYPMCTLCGSRGVLIVCFICIANKPHFNTTFMQPLIGEIMALLHLYTRKEIVGPAGL